MAKTTVQFEEIQNIAKKYAGKYKRSDLYEDLVQEGTLAGLEWVKSHPESKYSSLALVIKDAIYAYVNIKTLPVSMSSSSKMRGLVRNAKRGVKPPKKSNYKEDTIMCISNTVNTAQGTQVDDIDGYTDSFVEGAEVAFERDDTLNKVLRIVDTLPEPLRLTMQLVYVEGMSLVDVARVTGVSKQAVKQRVDKALVTIREQLQLDKPLF